TALYTLSLHDALPICRQSFSGQPSPLFVRVRVVRINQSSQPDAIKCASEDKAQRDRGQQTQEQSISSLREPVQITGCIFYRVRRSEEHTSELQSRRDL